MEYEKLKNELTLMNKRLGQEENFAKELSVINNKLQNNLSHIKGYKEVRETEKLIFYPRSSSAFDDENEDDDEIAKRKQAWLELEKE